MADILIDHLNKKSREHTALQTLVSQWDFDVKIIPKALQTVGNLFPHYSRHDESHSRKILINIERLLGDSVSLLTATDTWLILEAAYWHDSCRSSMAVNGRLQPQSLVSTDWPSSQPTLQVVLVDQVATARNLLADRTLPHHRIAHARASRGCRSFPQLAAPSGLHHAPRLGQCLALAVIYPRQDDPGRQRESDQACCV